jgi:hypothetical protein
MIQLKHSERMDAEKYLAKEKGILLILLVVHHEVDYKESYFLHIFIHSYMVTSIHLHQRLNSHLISVLRSKLSLS